MAALALLMARPMESAPRSPSPARTQLPAGSTQLGIENLEGVVLMPAILRGHGGRDTTGLLVVDTGAGFLGLDVPLARRLGIIGPDENPSGVSLSPTALPRLELGSAQLDAIAPILLLDAEVIRRATGRNVLGLAGQGVFAGRAVWIDYEARHLVFVASPPGYGAMSPHHADSLETAATDTSAFAERNTGRNARAARSRLLLSPLLSDAARAIPFHLAGDHKIVIHGRFRESAAAAPSSWLDLVFDTGATKSVLFESPLRAAYPAADHWRSVAGLVAPTLTGNATARIALAPVFELESTQPLVPLQRSRVDCAVINSDLAEQLSSATGGFIVGLVGYSFFKQYRVAVDYPNRVLWLDPNPKRRGTDPNARPFEYSHAGLQLERDGESIRVLGLAVDSPAHHAGIAVGDTLVAVGKRAVSASELSRASALLEGRPGTIVRITLRRDGVLRSYRLVRKQLL